MRARNGGSSAPASVATALLITDHTKNVSATTINLESLKKILFSYPIGVV